MKNKLQELYRNGKQNANFYCFISEILPLLQSAFADFEIEATQQLCNYGTKRKPNVVYSVVFIFRRGGELYQTSRGRALIDFCCDNPNEEGLMNVIYNRI